MSDTRDLSIFEMFEVFSDKMKKCIKYLAEPYLQDLGIRPHHVVFLFVIENNTGLSQKNLKEHVPYDKSRISMVIGELISLGLIRNTSQGKTFSLELTEKGKEVCEKVRAIVDDFKTMILSSIPSDELDNFLNGMKKFNEHLDTIIETHNSQIG